VTGLLADAYAREIRGDPAPPMLWMMEKYLQVGKVFWVTGMGIFKFSCGSAGSMEEGRKWGQKLRR
jgi:hypothetical protein